LDDADDQAVLVGNLMVRILIADDHYLIREGFKKLIDREIGKTVVAEAEKMPPRY
jgi:DNA-binding NarL/FixJ family response regulator